jgi:hypothetical protein
MNMKPKTVFTGHVIANIQSFPYSTPTPTDALEIARLSGGGDRMRPIY